MVFTSLHLCVLAGADITSSCTFKKGLVVKVKLDELEHVADTRSTPPTL